MPLRRPYPPVNHFVAVTFSDEDAFSEAMAAVTECYGDLDLRSPMFPFDHTSYYHQEMGDGLRKQFLGFAELRPAEELVPLKLLAMDIEHLLAIEGRRRVNIDPGYLELAKVVVASHKNYDHRVHLGHGVFGDVQLRYRGGRFVTNDWTYPDYASEVGLRFMSQLRDHYFNLIKQREHARN